MSVHIDTFTRHMCRCGRADISELQCVAVRADILANIMQCAAVCCIMAVCCSVLHHGSVLQCVASWQCAAVCCIMYMDISIDQYSVLHHG